MPEPAIVPVRLALRSYVRYLLGLDPRSGQVSPIVTNSALAQNGTSIWAQLEQNDNEASDLSHGADTMNMS